MGRRTDDPDQLTTWGVLFSAKQVILRSDRAFLPLSFIIRRLLSQSKISFRRKEKSLSCLIHNTFSYLKFFDITGQTNDW